MKKGTWSVITLLLFWRKTWRANYNARKI